MKPFSTRTQEKSKAKSERIQNLTEIEIKKLPISVPVALWEAKGEMNLCAARMPYSLLYATILRDTILHNKNTKRQGVGFLHGFRSPKAANLEYGSCRGVGQLRIKWATAHAAVRCAQARHVGEVALGILPEDVRAGQIQPRFGAGHRFEQSLQKRQQHEPGRNKLKFIKPN